MFNVEKTTALTTTILGKPRPIKNAFIMCPLEKNNNDGKIKTNKSYDVENLFEKKKIIISLPNRRTKRAARKFINANTRDNLETFIISNFSFLFAEREMTIGPKIKGNF